MIKKTVLFITILLVSVSNAASDTPKAAARLNSIEGNVSFLREGSEKWRSARPDMNLNEGDEIYTREESFAEIRFSNGTIVRMDEKCKFIISEVMPEKVKTKSTLGNIWVNMRKLFQKGDQFELSSPTATAAIRGTKFSMSTQKDSSTDVAVYTGKVDVGPTKDLKKRIDARSRKSSGPPVEVHGPQEIPGPHEVSLEHWQTIVAGQIISVKKNGEFSKKEFDKEEKADKDAFIKKNLALDSRLDKDDGNEKIEENKEEKNGKKETMEKKKKPEEKNDKEMKSDNQKAGENDEGSVMKEEKETEKNNKETEINPEEEEEEQKSDE